MYFKSGKIKEKSLIISWTKDNKSVPPGTAHTACVDNLMCEFEGRPDQGLVNLSK